MLRGARVTLRAIERADLPRWHEFNNNLAVELAGGGDPPEPQSLARLEAQYEDELRRGFKDGVSFGIECEGQLIGTCGLKLHDSVGQVAELGIAIGDTAYWGQGYGREAVNLLLEYAFRYRNLQRVWLGVHARNERAIRAYRACGFIEEGRQRAHVYSDGAYDDLVLMGILRSEWTG